MQSNTTDSATSFEQFALQDISWCTFLVESDQIKAYHHIGRLQVVSFTEGNIEIFVAKDLAQFWAQVSLLILKSGQVKG